MAGISEHDIAAVRSATDLVALIGEHVALRRQGTRFVGRCPFHAERTPSFSVNAEQGLYHCFGCQASGDAITFVRQVEHLDFAEAVERLAERAGLSIERDDPRAGAERRRRARIAEALEGAVEWYHERLLRDPGAAQARDYLRSRGYAGAVARRFKLGWAPEEWDALARAMGASGGDLRGAGLCFENRAGRLQDAFRARIMFPIFDPGGRAVGFGGRVLPGAPGPKYKNSAETPFYSKRRVLYGMNWAKANVVETGEVVVCEGYTDVIALFEAGIPRAVATCGTALGEEHFGLLRNFAQRVVLAFDADRAGQAAAERFYEWERRHELDIAVAALPEGSDPADLGRSDPDALRRAIEGAKPFLDLRVGRALASADLRSAEGRAKAAEAALRAVAEHPSALVRDQYVMVVADRCRLDHLELRRELARLGRAAGAREARRSPRVASAAPPAERRRARAERAALGSLWLAVNRPELVADRLEAVLFEDPVHRAAFCALAAAETLQQAIEGAGPEAAALLSRLSAEGEEAPEDAPEQLVRAAAEGAVRELQAEAKRDPEMIAQLRPVVAWLKLEIERMAEPTTAQEAAKVLLAWLVKRGEEVA